MVDLLTPQKEEKRTYLRGRRGPPWVVHEVGGREGVRETGTGRATELAAIRGARLLPALASVLHDGAAVRAVALRSALAAVRSARLLPAWSTIRNTVGDILCGRLGVLLIGRGSRGRVGVLGLWREAALLLLRNEGLGLPARGERLGGTRELGRGVGKAGGVRGKGRRDLLRRAERRPADGSREGLLAGGQGRGRQGGGWSAKERVEVERRGGDDADGPERVLPVPVNRGRGRGGRGKNGVLVVDVSERDASWNEMKKKQISFDPFRQTQPPPNRSSAENGGEGEKEKKKGLTTGGVPDGADARRRNVYALNLDALLARVSVDGCGSYVCRLRSRGGHGSEGSGARAGRRDCGRDINAAIDRGRGRLGL